MSALVVLGLLDPLREQGVDPNTLLTSVGLAPFVLDDLDARIPQRTVQRLWWAACQATGDADLGLHVGESLRPAAVDVLGYAVCNCPTLNQALAMAAEYYRFVRTGAEVVFVRRRDDARWVHRVPPFGAELGRHSAECVLAGVVTFAQSLTGVALIPKRVSFQHAAPPSVTEHQRVFGVRPSFGQEASALVIPAKSLELPCQSAPDPELRGVLERHVQALLARVSGRAPLVERAHAALTRELHGGRASLGRLAHSLGMSPRTLQRRLREHHTSYQRLLQSIRRELAQAYLHDSRLSITEVAFLLGYASPTGFHRAFRAWMGCAPSEYRRRITRLARSATTVA